ncbi:unnamed protein product [Xylocopa violacea]|uniref:Ribosomal protein S10 n=1 Tax=Xylocopa violacea TaxID=135666 RepID=A0ABP1N5H7_XYLVO
MTKIYVQTLKAIQVEKKNSSAETSEIILRTCQSAANNLEIEIIKPYSIDLSRRYVSSLQRSYKRILYDLVIFVKYQRAKFRDTLLRVLSRHTIRINSKENFRQETYSKKANCFRLYKIVGNLG